MIFENVTQDQQINKTFLQINEIDKSLDDRKDGCFPFWKYSVSVYLPKYKAMAFKHLGQDDYTS